MRKIFYSIFVLLVLFITSSAYAQPTSPPVLYTPANYATGVSLFPTFTWSSVPTATSYKIQIFYQSSLIHEASGITATNYTLTQAILAGNVQYYWSVCGVNTGGQGPYAAYFYFTTTISAPGTPVLIAPPDSSTNVSVTPTLDWDDVPGAEYYRVQVSTDPNFGTTVVNVGGLTNSAYVVQSGALSNNVTYYWKVNATNPGGTSPWSQRWMFKTIPSVPPAPNLNSPPNGATNVAVNVTLDWFDVTGATSYTAQISLNSDFTQIVFDENSTVSQITVPVGILSGTTLFYWRVSASNIAGSGPWSVVWHFTTGAAPPAAPVLLIPVNGAIGIARNGVLFDWNPVASATSYRIQISTDSTFATTFVNTGGLTSSQYTHNTPQFAYNTKYYWRVNATNSGGTGQWSQVWSFTTIIQTVPAPNLISPPNGATNISLTPLMDWTDVSGATSYRLQISTSSSFSSYALNIEVTASQYLVPSGILQGFTVYYWRVASINAGGQGSYSTPTWNFTTVQTFNLSLKVYLEGFWNGTTHVQDTIKIKLAQNSTPFTFKDSSNAVLGTNGQTTSIGFERASSGYYYLVIQHRNHLETWSANALYFSTGNTTNYDFTTDSNKAYGKNVKKVGSVWVLYGGDGNHDGYINSFDYDLFKTQFGLWGYKPCDYNGDWFVDGYDYPVQYNFGKSVIKPNP